jgi:uncharacterized protein (DUF2141 family)
MRSFHAVGCAAGDFLLACSSSSAADLTITIKGLRNSQGNVSLCVFSADGSVTNVFPDCESGKPIKAQKAAISGGEVVVTYKGLKDGIYAVAMIHDENGNGKLDTNFLGIPIEGLGVSNNPTLFGKPSFDEAKFNLRGNSSITIVAKYFM